MPATPQHERPADLDVAALDHLSGTLNQSYLQLERRLAALQQELAVQRPLAVLGEMTAGLAHQVRTPLATALVYACHLRDAPLAAAEQARFAGRLVERLRQLERLVADMLAFAHGADAGTQRFTVSDLLHAVNATVQPRRPQAVRLRLAAAPAAVYLTGSLENLAGALANLCLNAFEAGAGEVVVDCAVRDGTLRLTVSDDGPGMQAALRARVFEPFVSGRPGGTGLGLAVARGVVERHHGRLLLAESSVGCRFEVTLPCCSRQRRAAALALED
jgi:two-component system sensor histidine kinase FlrB